MPKETAVRTKSHKVGRKRKIGGNANPTDKKTSKKVRFGRTKNHTKKRIQAKVAKSKKDKDSDEKLKPVKNDPIKKKQPVVHKQFDLCANLIKMWEQLRNHKCSNRAEIIQNVLTIIRGRVKEFAFKHDTARVLQTVMKFGSAKQRLAIYEELKDSILELCKCKYSKFLVKKFLAYCPKQREEIMSAFYGNVRRLIKHTEAANILEIAYNDYANAHQREMLTREFYGLIALGDETESKVRRLKETIVPLLTKETLKHSIVHKPLLDYLTMSREQERSEMIEQVRERLVELLHTREGARSAMQCVWHGTAKDRKVIVKSLKTYVKKIAMEEHGHYVLLALFDSVDDTVLLKKAILSELSDHLVELVMDKYGRRVLLYLLCPRNPLHFNPAILSVLTPGDGNLHSKKPVDVRHSELLAAVSPPLVQVVSDHVTDWIRDKSLSQFLLAVVQYSANDCAAVLNNIVSLLEEPFDEQTHIVGDACGHAIVRKLLAIENARLDSTTCSVFLSELIISNLLPDQLRQWAIINRGAFVLSSLAASKVDGVRSAVCKALQSDKDQWRDSDLKGHQVLLKELT